MQTKICTKCKQELSINKFTKNEQGRFGVYSICKICKYAEAKAQHEANPEIRKDRARKYYKADPKKYNAQSKAYRIANPKKYNAMKRNWTNNNPKKRKAIMKKYYQKNRKNILLIAKQKRKTDSMFRLNSNISIAIRKSLNGNKNKKPWEKLVGYTINDLKKHLEKQFTKDMTWKLFLEGKIHIDHKIPKSVFNFTSPSHDDFKKCWALKNLQPMWAKENMSKGAKLNKHFQPSLLLKG